MQPREYTGELPADAVLDPGSARSESVLVGRRVVLGMLGAGMAGIFLGSHVQDLLDRFGGGGDGFLSSLLPTGGRFRIYSVTNTLPAKSPQDYRLRVDGLVDTPLELTYADLVSMAPTHLVRDFQCVTGWRVEDVPWTGVRLGDILDRAGVRPEGKALRFFSFDRAYTESLTLEQARRDDVLVAYEMQNGRVTRAHGGPVRLYVAPMYGYKSLKWLDRIEVTETVIPGYWELEGYDADAWVGRSNEREGDEAT